MLDRFSGYQRITKVKEVFIGNGYPKKFVDSVMKGARKHRQRKQNDGDPDKFIYIKLPYINEEYKRRATSVIRRSGIDNVKACFVNGKPLSKVFAAPKDKLVYATGSENQRQINCSSKCETCKSASKPNQCFRKDVVYEIKWLYTLWNGSIEVKAPPPMHRVAYIQITKFRV